MQQRAVSVQVIHWLEYYGRRQYDHHQASIVYFDKKSRLRIKREIGNKEYARIEKKLDAYFVEKDGYVITVGYRHKRINRH